MYNFNAKAELRRLEITTPKPGEKIGSSARTVSQGSVADCINTLMAKREPDRQIYSITMGPDFGMDATVLHYKDIEELYGYPGFPRT